MAELARTERVDKAVALHLSGYNCAQAVLCAFSDLIDMDERLLRRIASDLGGGLSGTHENACGAVTGMLIAFGLINGYDDIADAEDKKRVYETGAGLLARFKAEFGTLTCGVLKDEIAPAYAENRHPLVFSDTPKPCSQFVAYAAAVLDNYLSERESL
jgi:C_GCAxxG_C_C family probable redox protein